MRGCRRRRRGCLPPGQRVAGDHGRRSRQRRQRSDGADGQRKSGHARAESCACACPRSGMAPVPITSKIGWMAEPGQTGVRALPWLTGPERFDRFALLTSCGSPGGYRVGRSFAKRRIPLDPPASRGDDRADRDRLRQSTPGRASRAANSPGSRCTGSQGCRNKSEA